MKKSIFAAVAVLFVSFVGCGPSATDTSNTPPPPTAEDTQTDIEKAMESGEIDAASYGGVDDEAAPSE